MKHLLKSTALCISLILMIGIYGIIFWNGSLIPKVAEQPDYHIEMSMTP